MKKTFLIITIALAIIIAFTGVWLYLWLFNLPNVEGARVLVLVAENYNHLEYSYVVDALIRHGAEVVVASFNLEVVDSYDGGNVKPDMTLEDVKLENYHAIYIPGGYGPEELAKSELVLNIVREAWRRRLVVSAICHGPLVLAKADVIRGVRVTGYSAVLNELEQAGGVLVDENAVRDGYMVTGTDPSALPQFTKLLLEAIADKLKE